MSSADREFDVVVWGATGFTGSLVAEYLLSRYGTDANLRWAIAARDAAKLETLKTKLGPGARSLPAIVADSFDEQKLDALVSRTRVVISTVGPYAKYGSPLVAACVAHGTHYCDLAGEAQWIRRMIDRHHEGAVTSGARIVHCCGFDSVPMDIGVFYLQQEAKKRHGHYCTSIAMLVKAIKGGASGGTIASITNLIKESRADRSIAKILANPYALNPAGQRQGPDERDQRDVRFDEVAKVWTAPFIMADINTKVVRRSHALQGYPYGSDFRYREAMITGEGFSGRLKGTMFTAALGAYIVGASFDFSRGLLERFVLPEPGSGPDKNARQTGFFNLRQFGTLPDGAVMRTKITGDRDPGYGSTSKMLSECAVCLAKDPLECGGGVLTPAAAMGNALLERLTSNAGLTFEVLD